MARGKTQCRDTQPYMFKDSSMLYFLATLALLPVSLASLTTPSLNLVVYDVRFAFSITSAKKLNYQMVRVEDRWTCACIAQNTPDHPYFAMELLLANQEISA